MKILGLCRLASLLIATSLLFIGPAQAALSLNQAYVGHYGVSTDGWGSTTQSGTIRASVPAGATVTAAFLYTSAFGSPASVGGTLQGNTITYTALPPHPASDGMIAYRANVTSIVAPLINGGPGGTYNFSITETSGNQDGSALVVVYERADLPIATVGILDGFSASSGDAFALNFTAPLDPGAAGFFAELRLGIGYSCCDQRSRVTVNGTIITENAGNNDDSADASLSDGNLITVGSFDDPFSTLLPTYAADHERYNLVPYITLGNTAINVQTLNGTGDDNIFLAVFHVLGDADVTAPGAAVATPVPTLSEWGMILLAMAVAGFGFAALRRR